MANTHRLCWLLPNSAAARLATPDCCAIASKKHKIPSLKTPVAQSRFNLRSAYLAKRVSLPLRAITAASELRGQIPIAPAALLPPTSRDFVPWRFSDAGYRSARIIPPSRRPKTCTIAALTRRSSCCAISWCTASETDFRNGSGTTAILSRKIVYQLSLR
jgi:hypothetical protein